MSTSPGNCSVIVWSFQMLYYAEAFELNNQSFLVVPEAYNMATYQNGLFKIHFKKMHAIFN